MLVADVSVAGPAMWAARFHQLDIRYLKIAVRGDASLSPLTTVRLYEDTTYLNLGLRTDHDCDETQEVVWPHTPEGAESLLTADGASVVMIAPNEMSDEDDEGMSNVYWKSFTVAEGRVRKNGL